MRTEGGGYRCDYLRALTQRVEIDAKELRIMGSKSELLRTLVAASGAKTAGFGVPGSVPKYAVTQPIFHGGTLLHRELAAKATFDQTAAQYRGVVITAFQNVADALRAVQSDAVTLQRAVDSERAAARSLEIARRRLELGDINYLSLLTAQQAYQQALINLAQVKASRYADTVALFQALGGGWWNRSDVEPERPLSVADFLE